MKIAFVLDEEWDSALTHYAYGAYKALAENHTLKLFCLEGSYIDKKHNGEKIYIERLRNKNFLKSFIGFKSLSTTFKLFKPDIVVTTRGDAAFFSCLLKKSFNFTLVRIFGENKRLKTPRNCVDTVILPADFLREKVDKRKVGRLHVIKGFADESIFKFNKTGRNRIRELYGIKDGELLFGSVGRLDEVKGYNVLIKAFSKIKNGSKLMIVGEEKAQKADELRSLAGSLGIDERVIIINERRKDIVDIMSAFDVGVISSIGSETIARVMFEFISVGLPVVTTDVGMLKETAEDEFCTLAKANDEQSLFEAMKKIEQKDIKKAKSLALIAAKEYSFKRFCSQITDAIDSV